MAKKKESYEDSVSRLEAIVAELERNELSLTDSIKLFEEGLRLAEQCNQILSEAEQKVTILRRDESGQAVEEPFEI